MQRRSFFQSIGAAAVAATVGVKADEFPAAPVVTDEQRNRILYVNREEFNAKFNSIQPRDRFIQRQGDGRAVFLMPETMQWVVLR